MYYIIYFITFFIYMYKNRQIAIHAHALFDICIGAFYLFWLKIIGSISVMSLSNSEISAYIAYLLHQVPNSHCECGRAIHDAVRVNVTRPDFVYLNHARLYFCQGCGAYCLHRMDPARENDLEYISDTSSSD